MQSLRRLAGKVCIVTGASSGLGRAIALGYAREGAAGVVCADLGPFSRKEVPAERQERTHKLITSNGGRSLFVETDVSEPAAVQRMAEKAMAEFGRIDVLVNNAGISLEAGRPPARLHETPQETWFNTVSVNLSSIYLTCKNVIPHMLERDKDDAGDRGWIINLSSIYGLVGGKHVSSYCAAKGGVTNLTRAIAMDYASDGIHCNAICPGYTDTAIFVETAKSDDPERLKKLHPLHGIGKPQDLVGAAVFLASSEARWVTGANLSVDGGYAAQ